MELSNQQINEQGFSIRALKITDADCYFKLLTHPKVTPYIPKQLQPQSMFDTIRFITQLKSLAMNGQGAYWAICDPNGQLVGACGFESWNQYHRRLELSYELHPDYQGRGLMTQALLAIIDIGFNQMHAIRIEAFTLTDNQPSVNLLKRLGFMHEAELRKYRMFQGKIHNIHLFSLLNDSD